MSAVLTLQSATTFNAANLNGTAIATQKFPAVLVWFTPGASYDGTANLEISPDDGATWFPIDGYAVSVIETPLNTVASPAAATLYVVLVPADCLFRVRMSGGTQGTLTVEAKRTYFTR